MIQCRMDGQRSDLARLSARAQDLRSDSRALIVDHTCSEAEELKPEGLGKLRNTVQNLEEHHDTGRRGLLAGAAVDPAVKMVETNPRTVALELGTFQDPLNRMRDDEMRDLVAEVDDIGLTLVEGVAGEANVPPPIPLGGTSQRLPCPPPKQSSVEVPPLSPKRPRNMNLPRVDPKPESPRTRSPLSASPRSLMRPTSPARSPRPMSPGCLVRRTSSMVSLT